MWVESGCIAKAEPVGLDVAGERGREKGVTETPKAGARPGLGGMELPPPEREAAEGGFGREQRLVLWTRGGFRASLWQLWENRAGAVIIAAVCRKVGPPC